MQRIGARPRIWPARSALCAPFLLVAGCNLDNPGVSAPRGALAYPIAVTFGDHGSGPHDVLYVANSNFNLRYNGGSVQAFDVAAIERRVEPCRTLGLPGFDAELPPLDAGVPLDGGAASDAGTTADAAIGSADAGYGAVPLEPTEGVVSGYERVSQYGHFRGVLCDGLDRAGVEVCCFGEDVLAELFVGGSEAKGSEIVIDSLASGIALSPDEKRLYVPTRSRDRILYLDVLPSGQLSCGDEAGRCKRGADYRDTSREPARGQPPQPTAITTGRLADLTGSGQHTYLATVHETGEAALFVDRGERGPVLESVIDTGEARLTSITFAGADPLLYVTGSSSFRVARVGAREVDGRAVLYRSTPLLLTQVASARDTRDVVVDTLDPTRLFVLMRGSAQSLVVLRLDPESAREAQLEGETRVGAGPSRLASTTLGGRRLLLVSCFDERAIYVIDQESRDLVAVIHGFSGPFEMVIDEARALLFVADFRANVLRVVDVAGLADPRKPPPRIIATLGDPSYSGGL